jgi:tRNA(Ile)-lysidine synthase
MNLEKTFTDFLKREKLENQKLLIAVSGGVDSRVLLEVANKFCAQENVVVFHLNHNTRKSSTTDCEFVQNLCTAKGFQFFSEKLETKPEKNKENSWRDSRKVATQNIAKKCGAKRILTAHHATDLVETMIFRMTKGAGLDGMTPFDISTKPFWQVPKSEIGKYASEHNLKFVIDESNQSNDFERNLIRNEVLPELRKITPNLEKVFVKNFEIFGDTKNFLDAELNKSISETENSILLKDFLAFPVILQKEFLRKVAKKTPSFSEIKDTLKWLLNKPKGNSKKIVGETKLKILKGRIVF